AGGAGAVFRAFRANQFLELQLFFHSIRDLAQGELHPHAQIAALYGATLLATTETAKASTATECTAEDVAELREDVVHVHPASLESTAAHAGTGVSKAIKTCLLLRVAQDLIRVGCLLETVLNCVISRVLVGMMLDGQ